MRTIRAHSLSATASQVLPSALRPAALRPAAYRRPAPPIGHQANRRSGPLDPSYEGAAAIDVGTGRSAAGHPESFSRVRSAGRPPPGGLTGSRMCRPASNTSKGDPVAVTATPIMTWESHWGCPSTRPGCGTPTLSDRSRREPAAATPVSSRCSPPPAVGLRDEPGRARRFNVAVLSFEVLVMSTKKSNVSLTK